MRRYILYRRVSRKKQAFRNKGVTIHNDVNEERGLGLQAQQHDIDRYIEFNPGVVLGEYIEVETGTAKKKRPELAKALAHARAADAILIIAKIDRLGRNLAFITALMDSGVEFIACDLPSANRVTIQVMAVIAEEEARMISKRVTQALGVLKEKGVKLGSAREGHWDGDTLDGTSTREERRLAGAKRGREVAQESVKKKIREKYSSVLSLSSDRLDNGVSLNDIVEELNSLGYQTRKKNMWTLATLRQLLSRELGVDKLIKAGVMKQRWKTLAARG